MTAPASNRPLTEGEARRWVLAHWADYIANADPPDPIPDAASEVWRVESDRIVLRILRSCPLYRAALTPTPEPTDD